VELHVYLSYFAFQRRKLKIFSVMGKHKDKKLKKKKKSKRETSSDEDSGDKWVEKATEIDQSSGDSTYDIKGTKSVDKNSFDEFSSLPTITHSDIKRQRLEAREKKAVSDIYDPSTHSRELNPYWKEGGLGVPSTDIKTASDRSGGVEWLTKAYERSQELAKQENRSLEDVVAERYGSLQELKAAIESKKASVHNSHKMERSDRGNKAIETTRDRNVHSPSDTQRHRSSEKDRVSFSKSDFDGDQQSSRKRSTYETSSVERNKESRRDDSGWKDSGVRWTEVENTNRVKAMFQRPDTESKNTSRVKAMFQRPDTESRSTSERVRSQIKHESNEKDDAQTTLKESVKQPEVIISNKQAEVEGTVTNNQTEQSKAPKASLRPLTAKEKNEIGAKILRAELLGNDKLAKELKATLESGQTEVIHENDAVEKVIVLSRTSSSGVERPVLSKGAGESLADMMREERMLSSTEQDNMFLSLATKSLPKHQFNDDIVGVDKMMDSAETSAQKYIDREQQQAVIESRRMAKFIDKCEYCFDKVAKHLIVSIGSRVYLSLPSCLSVTEGHCLIVPMQHATQSTVVDEDVWAEIQKFRMSLTRLFAERDEDCVFMETAMNLSRHPHMCIECIPLPREVGDLAPIYFKKAIQESGSEWADNKKCIDISKKSIRNAVPKGFPYFTVDFGMQGGFAHVIEDEKTFPSYFGREIVGGMLNLNPSVWRKPKPETFEDQCKKVLQFATQWKTYEASNM
jgi:hypothetical protein